MRVFWLKGYHATSLKDLESALNMKPGSIYAAFTNKEQLYRSALELYFIMGRQGFTSGLSQSTSPILWLSDYLRAIGKPSKDDAPCFSCMLTKTLMGATEQETNIAQDARRYMDEMRAEFTRAFELAKAQQEIPQSADTDRLALRFQSCITVLKLEMQRGTDPNIVLSLADDLVSDLTRFEPEHGLSI